jgi:rhodanese-related sulfurtransferase
MKLITRQELKAKLDQGDDFKLVMVLAEYAFNAKHIPGSLNISTPEPDPELLKFDEEVVVYCSGPDCHASVDAFYTLEACGYTKVRRYAGGIQDWEEAGYSLEGEMVD